MRTLITTIKTSVWMLLCLLCTISCTQEEIWNAGNQDYAGKPIQITVSGPDNYAIGRAAKEPKKEFKNGDIIHISTAFTYTTGTQAADQASVVYSCLKYNGSSWTETTDPKTFTWPWNAEKATFTAYYIPAAGSYTNSSFMKPGDVTINLSDLSNSDPLYATHADVVAGGSVYLQFNHLLTKVTFTNMEEKKVTLGQELRLVADCDDQMIFTRVENGKTIDQLVHTSSQATGYITSQCEENSSILECTFLVPAIAAKSTIKLAYKDMSPYHSLELPKDLLPEGLEAGKHYIIDVTKLADNFISDAIKEQDWNTDGVVRLDADNVKKYLESIRDGEECSVEINGKNTQILVTYKEIIDGQDKDVVAQIKDVEFNIVEGESFTPVNIRQNIIFQGNGHKISTVKITNTIQDDSYPDVPSPKGVACKALFGKNNGTIKNLIIEDASIKAGNTQEAYAAILTGQNVGTIENVTIKNVEIKVTSATQIGSLAGANSYIVSNCQITGKVSITVEQSTQHTSCYIGGLVGYASGESKITNCSINADTEKQISIKRSYQNCFAGGIAGFIENHSESCATNLTIDADNVSSVTKLYAGGFAGQAKGTISKATATGNISILTTLNKDIYIGGFTGELQNGTLDDCAANGNITCAESLSTAGGMVGNMDAYTQSTAITYSSATGTITNGMGGMVGTATKGTGTLSISNSFCINDAAQFITSGETNVTPENCHQKGIVVGGSDSFTPTDDERWTNTPAIYGKDTKDAAIYYLKRNL